MSYWSPSKESTIFQNLPQSGEETWRYLESQPLSWMEVYYDLGVPIPNNMDEWHFVDYYENSDCTWVLQFWLLHKMCREKVPWVQDLTRICIDTSFYSGWSYLPAPALETILALPNLKSLSIRVQLYGDFGINPTTLKDVSNVESLSITVNADRFGTLPIQSLKNLKELVLIGICPTKFDLDILRSFEQLKKLHIQGSIAEISNFIGSLSLLRELDLSENRLTNLPQEIVRCAHLEILRLRGNLLTCLPIEIGELKELKVIDLSSNQLTLLPSAFCSLTHTNQLNLSDNYLIDLPTHFAKLTRLVELNLSGNKLTILPDDLGGCKRLELISVKNNQLSALPRSLVQLKYLHTFDASINHLEFFPNVLLNLPRLQNLYLSKNKIGHIPVSMSEIKIERTLHTFFIDFNLLDGRNSFSKSTPYEWDSDDYEYTRYSDNIRLWIQSDLGRMYQFLAQCDPLTAVLFRHFSTPISSYGYDPNSDDWDVSNARFVRNDRLQIKSDILRDALPVYGDYDYEIMDFFKRFGDKLLQIEALVRIGLDNAINVDSFLESPSFKEYRWCEDSNNHAMIEAFQEFIDYQCSVSDEYHTLVYRKELMGLRVQVPLHHEYLELAASERLTLRKVIDAQWRLRTKHHQWHLKMTKFGFRTVELSFPKDKEQAGRIQQNIQIVERWAELLFKKNKDIPIKCTPLLVNENLPIHELFVQIQAVQRYIKGRKRFLFVIVLSALVALVVCTYWI